MLGTTAHIATRGALPSGLPAPRGQVACRQLTGSVKIVA